MLSILTILGVSSYKFKAAGWSKGVTAKNPRRTMIGTDNTDNRTMKIAREHFFFLLNYANV